MARGQSKPHLSSRPSSRSMRMMMMIMIMMVMMLTMTMWTLMMMFNSRRAIKTLSVIWGMKQEHEDDIFDGHDGEDIHPDDIGFNQEVMETEMKRCDKSDKRENERETLSLGQFVSSWDGDAGTMSTSSHMTHTN